MQQGALAYAATAQKTASPRELEAQLLLRAARKLAAASMPEATNTEIREAANFNRRLWTIFVAAVTDETSPLPVPLRQNLANIGIFVLNRSVELEAAPERERIAPLVSINRNIAAGLAGRA